MLKTSRHSEAFFNWACRVCSCRACRSHRSRSCWIWARSTSCAFSVWMAPWTAVVRPRTADTQNRQKNIVCWCTFPQTYYRNRNIETNKTNKSIYVDAADVKVDYMCSMKTLITCTVWPVWSLRKAEVADLCCCNLSQQYCSWRSHPSIRATVLCCYGNIMVLWVKSGMKCGERARATRNEKVTANFKDTVAADGPEQKPLLFTS